MSEPLCFDKSNIFLLENMTNHQEVLRALAHKLQEKGNVNSGYLPAILKREEQYPTGLAAGEINVAIPHADVEYVTEGAIAVGVLNHPVAFSCMDDPERQTPVQVVFMLALKEPHGHIEMLQKVVALIQNQDALQKIVHSNDVSEIYTEIAAYLL